MTITLNSIDQELESKAVVIRDGSRGWRLSACLIEDALDLLDASDEMREEYAVPDEDSEDYEFVNDMANELEDKLFAAGYYVYNNDGYVIYKDLSEAPIAELSDF